MTMNFVRLLWLIALAGFYSQPSYATLFDRGNSLIYDDVSDVTWIQDGGVFSRDILVSGRIDGLIGYQVDPQLGGPYTISAADYVFEPALNRHVTTWYGAMAWAETFALQAAGVELSAWRAPTSEEMLDLYNQFPGPPGSSKFGDIDPFTSVRPFVWGVDEVDQDTARNFRFGAFNMGIATDVAKINLSNAWAVASGDVAPVPVPAAIYLFVSALFTLFGGRKRSLVVRR